MNTYNIVFNTYKRVFQSGCCNYSTLFLCGGSIVLKGVFEHYHCFKKWEVVNLQTVDVIVAVGVKNDSPRNSA